MRTKIPAVALLVIGVPVAGQDAIGDPTPIVSRMGLAELEHCGQLAVGIEADREVARRSDARLAARFKAIGAEDKAINAARSTIDLRSAAAVAAFNKRVAANMQAVAAYNRDVNVQRVAAKPANTRSNAYNVQCAQRPFDPALLAQVTPAASKAIKAHSSSINMPAEVAETATPDAGAVPGTIVLSGTTNPNEAMPIAALQSAAAAGNSDAQLLMGLAYHEGRTVPYNLEQAIGWLEKSAAGNNSKAMLALSQIFAVNGAQPDEKRSLSYLQSAAEAGNPDAQHNLGLRYTRDDNGRPDLPQAVRWLTKAATAGDPESQYVLARVLLRGSGDRKDGAEGLVWLRRSAEQGFRPAQQLIGERFERGDDLPKDKVEALKWYLLAAGLTKVDPARGCVRLIGHSGEVRADAREAADKLRKALPADAVETATQRADEWIVSFKTTKVGGC